MQRTVADAGRAAGIIRRIRSMAGGGVPERAPTQLNEIIEEAMLFLRHELQRQQVDSRLRLDADLPELTADRIQLQQVVVNLAMNAIQAMAEAGVSERRLTVRTSSRDGEARVDVEDTGPGLSADQAARVFESFFTTKSGGLGVGLAICRSIIDAHGGRIDGANGPEGGARFTFTLPIGPQAIA